MGRWKQWTDHGWSFPNNTKNTSHTNSKRSEKTKLDKYQQNTYRHTRWHLLYIKYLKSKLIKHILKEDIKKAVSQRKSIRIIIIKIVSKMKEFTNVLLPKSYIS